MFRKIVSNLAFSPALVGQLGFYAKRLRKEEATRRIGLIFTVLALIVQSFAVFQPPEAANASSPADFVPGGITSINGFLKHYDKNTRNVKSVFSSLGITRDEIKAAKSGTVGKSGYYNWSMTSLYSYSQGQRSYNFYKSNGSSGKAYYRPIALTQEGRAPYPVYIGHSKKFGWFAIKKDCGNLVTNKRPPSPKPPSVSCVSLTARMLTRTDVRLDARAKKGSGATISAFTYVIKNNKGSKLLNRTVSTHGSTSSIQHPVPKTGKYTASVTVSSSLGKKTSSACQTSFTVSDVKTPPPATPSPSAICSNVSTHIIGRTNVELSGSAQASNGAKIEQYNFVVKDKKGKTIAQQSVKTTASQASTKALTISQDGKYSVTLSVKTSVGTKSGSNCIKDFTIAPPEMCPINPSLLASSPDCQPCPGNLDIWVKDSDCKAKIVETKTASNIDQSDKPAGTTLAKSSDRILYTINVRNQGSAAANTIVKDQLGDVLEYATLIDKGGGLYDKKAKTLSWSGVTVKPGEDQSRTFVVRILKKVPATNTGISNGSSYDCTMTNTVGNSIDVDVNCPVKKVVVEQVVSELPTTGPTENMLFAGGLLAVVAYFYARSRQVNKEIRLIRRDAHAGTI